MAQSDVDMVGGALVLWDFFRTYGDAMDLPLARVTLEDFFRALEAPTRALMLTYEKLVAMAATRMYNRLVWDPRSFGAEHLFGGAALGAWPELLLQILQANILLESGNDPSTALAFLMGYHHRAHTTMVRDLVVRNATADPTQRLVLAVNMNRKAPRWIQAADSLILSALGHRLRVFCRFNPRQLHMNGQGIRFAQTLMHLRRKPSTRMLFQRMRKVHPGLQWPAVLAKLVKDHDLVAGTTRRLRRAKSEDERRLALDRLTRCAKVVEEAAGLAPDRCLPGSKLNLRDELHRLCDTALAKAEKGHDPSRISRRLCRAVVDVALRFLDPEKVSEPHPDLVTRVPSVGPWQGAMEPWASQGLDSIAMACEQVLLCISRFETTEAFHVPVRSEEVPTYFDHIRDPMDLRTIHRRLRRGVYGWGPGVVEGFRDELRLVWANAKRFNFEGSDLWCAADYFEDLSERLLKPLPGSVADTIQLIHKSSPPGEIRMASPMSGGYHAPPWDEGCCSCGKDAEEPVLCDGCNREWHVHCAGLTAFPTEDKWICPLCKTNSFVGSAMKHWSYNPTLRANQSNTEAESDADEDVGDEQNLPPATQIVGTLFRRHHVSCFRDLPKPGAPLSRYALRAACSRDVMLCCRAIIRHMGSCPEFSVFNVLLGSRSVIGADARLLRDAVDLRTIDRKLEGVLGSYHGSPEAFRQDIERMLNGVRGRGYPKGHDFPLRVRFGEACDKFEALFNQLYQKYVVYYLVGRVETPSPEALCRKPVWKEECALCREELDSNELADHVGSASAVKVCEDCGDVFRRRCLRDAKKDPKRFVLTADMPPRTDFEDNKARHWLCPVCKLASASVSAKGLAAQNERVSAAPLAALPLETSTRSRSSRSSALALETPPPEMDLQQQHAYLGRSVLREYPGQGFFEGVVADIDPARGCRVVYPEDDDYEDQSIAEMDKHFAHAAKLQSNSILAELDFLLHDDAIGADDSLMKSTTKILPYLEEGEAPDRLPPSFWVDAGLVLLDLIASLGDGEAANGEATGGSSLPELANKLRLARSGLQALVESSPDLDSESDEEDWEGERQRSNRRGVRSRKKLGKRLGQKTKRKKTEKTRNEATNDSDSPLGQSPSEQRSSGSNTGATDEEKPGKPGAKKARASEPQNRSTGRKAGSRPNGRKAATVEAPEDDAASANASPKLKIKLKGGRAKSVRIAQKQESTTRGAGGVNKNGRNRRNGRNAAAPAAGNATGRGQKRARSRRRRDPVLEGGVSPPEDVGRQKRSCRRCDKCKKGGSLQQVFGENWKGNSRKALLLCEGCAAEERTQATSAKTEKKTRARDKPRRDRLVLAEKADESEANGEGPVGRAMRTRSRRRSARGPGGSRDQVYFDARPKNKTNGSDDDDRAATERNEACTPSDPDEGDGGGEAKLVTTVSKRVTGSKARKSSRDEVAKGKHGKDYIGLDVAREFDGEVYTAMVADYFPKTPGQKEDLYHLLHDDGDEEDVNLEELLEALRLQRERAQGDSRSRHLDASSTDDASEESDEASDLEFESETPDAFGEDEDDPLDPNWTEEESRSRRSSPQERLYRGRFRLSGLGVVDEFVRALLALKKAKTAKERTPGADKAQAKTDDSETTNSGTQPANEGHGTDGTGVGVRGDHGLGNGAASTDKESVKIEKLETPSNPPLPQGGPSAVIMSEQMTPTAGASFAEGGRGSAAKKPARSQREQVSVAISPGMRAHCAMIYNGGAYSMEVATKSVPTEFLFLPSAPMVLFQRAKQPSSGSSDKGASQWKLLRTPQELLSESSHAAPQAGDAIEACPQEDVKHFQESLEALLESAAALQAHADDPTFTALQPGSYLGAVREALTLRAPADKIAAGPGSRLSRRESVKRVAKEILFLAAEVPRAAYSETHWSTAFMSAWKSFVQEASTPCDLMQALLLYEQAVQSSLPRWFIACWGSPTLAMRRAHSLPAVSYRLNTVRTALAEASVINRRLESSIA